MNEKPFMLTTIDNPFNPFKSFDEWKSFDESKGYKTCELLSRFTSTSESMTENEEKFLIGIAIEDIITSDVTNKYIKVFEDTIIRQYI